MTERYWEQFILDDEGDEILHLDEQGNVIDEGDADLFSGQTRYRYRTTDPSDAAAENWLFLQEIDGVWHWWTYKWDGEYFPIRNVHSVEEAQAVAIALWRME